MPQGNNIYNYNLKIFSKWGVLLFEANDITVGWMASSMVLIVRSTCITGMLLVFKLE